MPFTPPLHDRLGVLTATAQVMQEARRVTLDFIAIESLADSWSQAPWLAEDTGFTALHFNDGTARTANWVLLLDALNFCFWSLPDQPRWRIAWRDTVLDGYNALAASLTRAVAEGRPLWDARYLADLDAETLTDILRPVAGSPPIPLFEQRLAHAHEVGRVLLEKYDGLFPNAIAAAQSDGVTLALLLAREFPSFADVALWRGQRIPFLKRAQICVADLHTLFRGEGYGAIGGLDGLTAFADYKLPQVLRRFGIVQYAPEIAAQVESYTLLPSGSEGEIEIRAATIWAVELLRRALTARGVLRTASAIDYRLWAESQSHPADEKPYHRTYTIYY